MSKPNGKLAMAYSTIATMEARIKELECQRPAGVAAAETVGWVWIESRNGEDWDMGFHFGSEKPDFRVSHAGQAFEYSALVARSKIAAPHPVSGEQKTVSCASCQDSACDPRFIDLVPCPDCAAKPSDPEFFIDHAILRKALGMYGISAPESDHELGDRMGSYAIKVIKAVAKLPFPAAQDVAGLVEALEEIAGGRSSKSDPYIARQALAARRAQQGEQP